MKSVEYTYTTKIRDIETEVEAVVTQHGAAITVHESESEFGRAQGATVVLPKDEAIKLAKVLLEQVGRSIPIATQDAPRQQIGSVDVQTDRLCFRFSEPVPRKELFGIFGNAGIRITEMARDGSRDFVIAGEILEFFRAKVNGGD